MKPVTLGLMLEIRTNEFLTIGPFEDWSACRSPSRAKRRRRQGHPQRVRYFSKPDPKVYQMPRPWPDTGDMLVCHPETARAITDALPKWKTQMDGNPRPEHYTSPILREPSGATTTS